MNGIIEKHSNVLSEDTCPLCGSKQLIVFLEITDVPVHCNVLWSNQDEALKCPTGDIKLVYCPSCSFVYNVMFDSSRLEYTEAYENALDFSPFFQNYLQSLASRLVEGYKLNDKDILEIGCGNGNFLRLLCKLGKNRGVGFDPAFIEQKEQISESQVKFVQDFYSERYKEHQANLVVCRQTLEHLPNPKNFLKMLRLTISKGMSPHFFFEVPNAKKIFSDLFVWDIIYEHCSYFTSVSLAYSFLSSGFRVLELTEEFESQFLGIHTKVGNQNTIRSIRKYSSEIYRTASDIASFNSEFKRKIKTYKDKIGQIESKGQRAVVWGAGSKGVTFLNQLKDFQIKYVVDINPRKHGMYIPGTGQQIVEPKFLLDYKPEIIIVMNPIYADEIRQIVKNLGLNTQFMFG